MRIEAVVVACALACRPPAIASPEGARDREFAVEVIDASLALIPAFVNGRGPFALVADTGATTTVLDEDVAKEIGLQPSGALQIVTTAGTFRAPTTIVDDLAVGAATFVRMTVSWMPMRELRTADRRIAGVLGQDVLARTTFEVDYRRGKARLGSACHGGDTRVDVDWVDGRPTLRAGLRTPGLPPDARFVLDTAANALIIFREPAHTKGTVIKTHRSSADADVLSRVELSIGGLQAAGPALVVSSRDRRQETGLLPATWFSRVCIDGPRRTATLTR